MPPPQFDNAGIFSTNPISGLQAIIENLAVGAKLTVSWEGLETVFTCEWPGVTVRISQIPNWDRNRQIAGMKGFLSHFPRTPQVASLLAKADQTVDSLGSLIIPRYDPAGRAAALVTGVATALNGYLFSYQSFYDIAGKWLVGRPDDPQQLCPVNSDYEKLLARRTQILTHDTSAPSSEALARKAASIARLKQLGIPVHEGLPVIADSTQAKRRTKEEIANRAMAVCLVAIKGEGLEQDFIDGLADGTREIRNYLTPNEKAFIEDLDPTPQERGKFSWQYERYWVFLWVLGYVDPLGFPGKQCDVAFAVDLLFKRPGTTFLDDAKLRSIEEILDATDFIYRCHWATVSAYTKGKSVPGLDGGVSDEWHHALNWTIGYMNQEWDDVSTDT